MGAARNPDGVPESDPEHLESIYGLWMMAQNVEQIWDFTTDLPCKKNRTTTESVDTVPSHEGIFAEQPAPSLLCEAVAVSSKRNQSCFEGEGAEFTLPLVCHFRVSPLSLLIIAATVRTHEALVHACTSPIQSSPSGSTDATSTTIAHDRSFSKSIARGR
jgi:hypothetical protein